MLMTSAPGSERVHGPTHDGEKLCHIIGEDDPDTALCGKDVTGWPWNPPWPYCAVCLDLAGYGERLLATPSAGGGRSACRLLLIISSGGLARSSSMCATASGGTTTS